MIETPEHGRHPAARHIREAMAEVERSRVKLRADLYDTARRFITIGVTAVVSACIVGILATTLAAALGWIDGGTTVTLILAAVISFVLGLVGSMVATGVLNLRERNPR